MPGLCRFGWEFSSRWLVQSVVGARECDGDGEQRESRTTGVVGLRRLAADLNGEEEKSHVNRSSGGGGGFFDSSVMENDSGRERIRFLAIFSSRAFWSSIMLMRGGGALYFLVDRHGRTNLRFSIRPFFRRCIYWLSWKKKAVLNSHHWRRGVFFSLLLSFVGWCNSVRFIFKSLTESSFFFLLVFAIASLVCLFVLPHTANDEWICTCEVTNLASNWIMPGSLWNCWHLPSRTKTKDLFINLRFNYFTVFTVGMEPFLCRFN